VVEGARLESVYTFTRIEGSNPSLSATFSPVSASSRGRSTDPAETPLNSGALRAVPHLSRDFRDAKVPGIGRDTGNRP
jgi:hypothetical protein